MIEKRSGADRRRFFRIDDRLRLAVRRVPGVAGGVQYTLPVPGAVSRDPGGRWSMIRSHPQVCLGRVVRPPGPRFLVNSNAIIRNSPRSRSITSSMEPTLTTKGP